MTDSPEPRPRSAVAWTSTAIVVAAVALLLVNPASLKGWIAQQPPEAVPPAARTMVQAWWDIAEGLGLTAPRAAIERLWKAAQGLTWPAAPEGRRAG